MMKRISVISLLICVTVGGLIAQSKQVASPDGKLVVTVSANSGSPEYSVSLKGVTFIDASPIGLVTNVGDFSTELDMNNEVKVTEVNDTYELPNIKFSKVNYNANEAVFSFAKDGRSAIDVIFRVSNNDIAFKYKVYPQKENIVCVVENETTGFNLPEGTTTFLCPQSDPMKGFARTSPSYETPYTVDETIGKNGWGNGYTFPCLFKVKDNGWVLISETGVDASYCASRLVNSNGGLYNISFPQEGENNGNGTISPGIALPGETPWRTITVGKTLKPIIETTIAFDVVKPKYEASKEYKYTKGSWSWIIKMDGGTTYDVQKEYIDFSAAMGWKTILVDALWDTQIGRDKIAELAEYGASKKVGLYLWYNSNGYWNDAPQGPRGLMDNSRIRREEMAWMQNVGIKGIKVDFFGGDKQITMQLYEDILADANDYGLQVIFHGCTLPRGWERMYPNFASSEAVLASENLHFSQGSCDAEAFNACLHPFIRNAVGSMDFGGSALNQFYNANNTSNRGSKRMTSDVFALATAVLFQSGVQHFALAPNNLQNAPNWAIDFMKEVPSIWDEIRFIDGYPGKYVILARRSGSKWYIAGVNAQSEPLKIKVDLPMLKDNSKGRIYSDDKNLNGSCSEFKLNRKKQLSVSIPRNGGLLLVGE